ncbi:MAG: pssA, partial [Rhizobium sp.]|nr:pssA [Rhizobium sp.]
FSGKSMSMRVPPEMVLPVFVGVVLFIALLIGYPWHTLSVVSLLYLASLPIGWKSYRDQERALAASTAVVPVEPEAHAVTPYASAATEPAPDDRPSHLN